MKDELLAQQEKRLQQDNVQKDNVQKPPKKAKKEEKSVKRNAKISKTSLRATKGMPSELLMDPLERPPSALWDQVSITRNEVVQKVAENPPKHIPKTLHAFIPNMVEFYLYLWERQYLFLGKDRSTCSPPFRNRHFCNNYRELDRGTGYLRSELLRLKDDLASQGKWPLTRSEWTAQVLGMAYHYRLCNRLSSFSPDPSAPLPKGIRANPVGGIPRVGEFNAAFVEYVQDFETTGYTFFTNAHQSIKFGEYIAFCKQATESNTIPSLAEKIVNACPSMFEICNLLLKLEGVGEFQAWQLACDLEEAGCLDLQGKDEYTKLGPGAKSGLNNIFGLSIAGGGNYTSLELARILRNNLNYGLGLVDESFPLWKEKPITLKVIEHALCEISKYLRINFGKSLRSYRTRNQYDSKRCQQCSRAKSMDTKGWICCHSCRNEYCAKCCKEGHCQQTLIAINRNSKNANIYPNLWNHCARCDSLDNCAFTNG